LTSEIIPLLSACRWLERRARRVLRPRRTPGGGLWQFGQTHRVVRAPLGRVAIIATWNYPVQLLGVQLAQALLAGNQVTVKPSERCPRTQGLLLDLAIEAGLPEERLARVGSEREAGERLLREQRFDHVVFTGSTGVGRTVASILSESLTPSTLELSGSDSAIVLADADPSLAARSILFALRLNGGQTCMAPRRVIAERAIAGRLLDAIRGELARPVPMTPAMPAEMERAYSCARDAARAGGCWLVGESGSPPFIIADCPAETPLFRGEHFGPALAITPADSAARALRLHGGVERKLATALFTGDPGRARALAARLGSTVVTINDCLIPTGHPGLSLGGLGPSGWGLSRGEAGLLAMTRPVFVSVTGRIVRTPTASPGAKARASVARLVRRLYT
jgi:aldehyde dehydrogenase (NAD+)